MLTYKDLSPEQQQFVDAALQGDNILVDACIGSGKTTAIQVLCNQISDGKQVLYLTYNKLLKLDAKSKIRQRNVQVTNYHGFCYMELAKIGVHVGLSNIIQEYNQRKPAAGPFDILILDEYQDIEEEVSVMLRHLKDCNPKMQIVAVGDMAQKIYDKTRLDAAAFIDDFLGNHLRMEFTRCFRRNKELAASLGEVWQKQIVGVNSDCKVKVMSFDEILRFVANCEPRQVLCLGSNAGKRNELLNKLEKEYESKFNKQTVWAKITENEGGATQPSPDAAIFTTYDGCKGMERDICILFDWTENYWVSRMMKPDARYEIIRNIFCVAASRAKKTLIIAKAKDNLSWETLKMDEHWNVPFQDVPIAGMFDFKYIEDVEDAYKKLAVKEISPQDTAIDIPTRDALIDLSPCIGIFQEADYFKGYDIDKDIEMFFRINKDQKFKRIPTYKTWTVEQKVLYLVSLETGQNRYWHQVTLPLVKDDKKQEIETRLKTRLPQDADVQVPCTLPFYKGDKVVFTAEGFADVVKDGVVYELKFVSELSHNHFLQCASYVLSLGLEKGILWNVRTNQAYEIRIPNKAEFLNCVVRAVTKGRLGKATTSEKKASPKKASTPKKSPVKTPKKKGGGDSYSKVRGFCKRNFFYCDKVFTAIDRKGYAGRPSPKDLKKKFDGRRLTLPVSQEEFAKYFYLVMTEMKYAS